MENNSTSPGLPQSPTRSGARGFDFWWSVAFAIGAILFAFGVVVLAVALGLKLGIAGLARSHPGPMVLMGGQIVLYAAVGIFVVAFLPFLARRSLRDLGIRAFGAREIGIGFLGAIGMTIVTYVLSSAMEGLTHHHETEAAVALLRELNTVPEKALFFGMAVVLAPLVEELAFRVFLFNAFARYAPVWIAALLSGAVFGAAHSQSLWQLATIGVPLAAGGAVLAAVYAWSRCYWSNVITHALFNALPLVLFFVFHVQTG